MSARKTVVHVEKLSRTEYNVTKNIPEAMPKKNFTLEKNKFPKKTPPTPFPSDLFNFISPNLQPETRYDSPQKNQQIFLKSCPEHSIRRYCIDNFHHDSNT